MLTCDNMEVVKRMKKIIIEATAAAALANAITIGVNPLQIL